VRIHAVPAGTVPAAPLTAPLRAHAEP
jgi:hypothetical protein